MAGERLDGLCLDDVGIKFLKSLYCTEYNGLVDYASYLLGNTLDKSTSEDMVQDVFLVGTLKINDLINNPNPVGWLYRTLQNLIRNERRGQQMREQLLQKLKMTSFWWLEPGPSELLEVEEVEEFQSICKQCLKEQDIAILTDVYCNGYSFNETALRYGLSASACKMRAKRAKMKLETALKETSWYS